MKEILTRPSNIKATMIADSINYQGVRICTMELEYPRFIHAEAKTHRMIKFGGSEVYFEQDVSLMDERDLSRNASSSRAVPTLKAIDQVADNMAVPLYWGANQGGMQAGGEVANVDMCQGWWQTAFSGAAECSKHLHENNLHKQHAARLIESFQMMKTLVTLTEFDNFFNLRLHPDAQPEIMRLAYEMYQAMQNSEPMLLKAGEWHLPYITIMRNPKNDDLLYFSGSERVTLEQAQRISASCCAQTSYRKTDTSLEKADFVFDRLIQSDVLHSSPFEHLATPSRDQSKNINGLDEGITHTDRSGNHWSGNLREWISYRHLLPNNTCNKFDFEKRMELFK